MKYFTPDLHLRLQDFSSDQAMDAADKAWEQARRRYRRQLQRVLPELPNGLRYLLENFFLHDADVLSMGREGSTFVIVLRLDVPPKEMLVLTYQLTAEAMIDMTALPPKEGPFQWMYDEVALKRGKHAFCKQSILLSNGWEMVLRFSDLQVVRTQTIYPMPGTILVPVALSAVPQSA